MSDKDLGENTQLYLQLRRSQTTEKVFQLPFSTPFTLLKANQDLHKRSTTVLKLVCYSQTHQQTNPSHNPGELSLLKYHTKVLPNFETVQSFTVKLASAKQKRCIPLAG